MLSIMDHLQLLMTHIVDETGRPFSVTHIARATGLSQQTLLNLLHGRADNPRLDTLQQLCQFYRISLDYFDSKSKAQCLHSLAIQGRLGVDPLTLREIELEASSLSPETAQNVLTMMAWRSLAHP
jgi:DNA-binding phage protein